MRPDKFTSTNKAEFYITENGQLLKQYVTEDATDRVAQDQRSLTFLNRQFNTVVYQGWTYSVVRYISKTSDGTGIYMEFIAGDTLSSLTDAASLDAEYRSGTWLALYHNKLMPGSYTGPIFTDLNVHNIIVDSEKKRVTIIDPGRTWGRTGNIYEDVIKHVNSILLVLVFRGKASGLSVLKFLKGYSSVLAVNFSLRAYYKGLFSQLHRELSDHATRSLPQSILFGTIVSILSIFYIAAVPWLLYKYARE